VYVDAIEGDAEGYVRFKSPVEAKAIIDARTGLQNKHSWQLEFLSGMLTLPLLLCRSSTALFKSSLIASFLPPYLEVITELTWLVRATQRSVISASDGRKEGCIWENSNRATNYLLHLNRSNGDVR
jgi:hypothetical protein